MYSYSIKARSSGDFVTANGVQPLEASRSSVSARETFSVSQPSSGYWAIEAENGNFVSVQSNSLVANVAVPQGSAIPDSALFRFVALTLPSLTSIDVTTVSQIKLYSKSAIAYISTDGYGNWQTLGDNNAEAAIFNIAPVEGGYTIQLASSERYTTADGAGEGALIANRGNPGGWETFIFTARAGGVYTIKAQINNKLVAPMNNDRAQVSASVTDGTSFPESAAFYVLAA